MEKDGLVKKTRDTTDRRVVYATMTEKGEKIIKAARRTGNKLIAKFTDIFTGDERETIYSLFKKLDKVVTSDLAERNTNRNKPSDKS